MCIENRTIQGIHKLVQYFVCYQLLYKHHVKRYNLFFICCMKISSTYFFIIEVNQRRTIPTQLEVCTKCLCTFFLPIVIDIQNQRSCAYSLSFTDVKWKLKKLIFNWDEIQQTLTKKRKNIYIWKISYYVIQEICMFMFPMTALSYFRKIKGFRV